ncbi:hypothetical protein H0H92_005369 [Tricholoma furcatifolium]|nr:hypothetical protein H0H92_005369 [Tricholoma furcatifolium]
MQSLNSAMHDLGVKPAQVDPTQVDPTQAIDDPIPPHPQRTYLSYDKSFIYGFKIDQDWVREFHEAKIPPIKNDDARRKRGFQG